MSVAAAVVGQDFGTVRGEVNAKVLSSFDVNIPQEQQVVQYNNGACKALNYTVYSNCEGCAAQLVLTPDTTEIAKSVRIEDNFKLNTSWSVLMSEPNYTALANHLIQQYIYLFYTENYSALRSNESYYKQNVNNTIKNFLTVSPEMLPSRLGTGVNKLRFPKEIYSYPLYIDIYLLPCPLGFTLFHNQCTCIYTMVVKLDHAV